MDPLYQVYCGNTGWEFMHLESEKEREWVASQLESASREEGEQEMIRRWKTVRRSEILDKWIGKKFPQVKRYSLEGAEALLLGLGTIASSAATTQRQVILSMPHRGRLNVLTSPDLLQFPSSSLIAKLSGYPFLPTDEGRYTDDVLSHLFASTDRMTLLPNPSQLEAATPVGQGYAYGLSHLASKSTPPSNPLNVTIHGDAAFTGQGVVAESVNMASLKGYGVRGSIRVIVNNQVGFTAEAREGRSSRYVTDNVKAGALVAHVNGDAPSDVEAAMQVLVDFREKFGKDVIMDLVTYRRWGHNELDEPFYTNPRMYKRIRETKTLSSQIQSELLSSSYISESEIRAFDTEETSKLDEALSSISSSPVTSPHLPHLNNAWRTHTVAPMEQDPSSAKQQVTGVAKEELVEVARESIKAPDAFAVHPRLEKILAKRLQAVEEGEGIDFATAEALAFGTLVKDGYAVRVSGQDCGRGTFSQRHAVLRDQNNGDSFLPLDHLNQTDAGRFEVINSPLSEYAVLGFEQGVAWSSPDVLPIWEAQFGDFFTGAQITIDTYFASGEAKWGLPSALTLLLPHGYDGAGSEHSSARIERFLQLSSEPIRRAERKWVPNVSLVNASTAAQYFHVLRRQMKQPYRRPLAVFTHKALLRSPVACSSLVDMAEGTSFQPVIDDSTIKSADASAVLFVSGQWYYQLLKARKERGLDAKVAIVRVEELSPFPYSQLEQVIKKYTQATSFVWAQEEPENAGAWTFVQPRLSQLLQDNQTLLYRGREALPVPAKSLGNRFKEEAGRVLEDAFTF
ncbi:thiamine diphosphate-binding protein [Atractiella rhizophila]|nr:thiamine diphosphate-binding protein [Atractiella rhizophila]